MHGLTNFNRDLGVQAGNLRYQVREFLPNGAAVYEVKEMPGLHGRFSIGSTTAITSAWAWGPTKRPIRKSIPRADDDLVGSAGRLGRPRPATRQAVPAGPGRGPTGYHRPRTAHAGGLGEFFVCHTNPGGWNVWTADGLLVGPIFHDMRHPKARPWSMTAHDRGMLLEDVTLGEEHFQGYFCRTADNRYYAVAGHNHIGVVEVLGLDCCRRLGGELTITAKLHKAQQWDVRRQREEVYQRAPVVDIYRVRKPLPIDGTLADWGPADAEISEGAELRLRYDDTHLYLACSTRGLGPLVNKGHEWDRLFKTGAAVDLLLGTTPPPTSSARCRRPATYGCC